MGIETKIKFHLRRIPWLKRILKKLLRIEAVNHQIAELERKLIYNYILPLQTVPPIKILDFGERREASFVKVTSQACSMRQMQEPEYILWCQRLNATPNFHRKHWEYNYILKALDQHKKMFKGAKGLGFGVGKDPIVAYMVKLGTEVIATDLDPESAHQQGWAQTNQYSEKLLNLNERKICTDKALRKQVRLRNVDMNAIPEDLREGQFDFVWSACAYEHLGSIEQGLQFVINSIECLKPGGIAVHTTEFNISSNDETVDNEGTVLFRKRDFENLAERLRAKSYKIDLNFNLGDQPLDKFYDVEPYSEFNHIKLKIDKFISTSYGIIVERPA